ncbi:MAG: hypothetical protein AAFR46_02690 [Pseudomonadota bacterium]
MRELCSRQTGGALPAAVSGLASGLRLGKCQAADPAKTGLNAATPVADRRNARRRAGPLRIAAPSPSAAPSRIAVPPSCSAAPSRICTLAHSHRASVPACRLRVRNPAAGHLNPKPVGA